MLLGFFIQILTFCAVCSITLYSILTMCDDIIIYFSFSFHSTVTKSWLHPPSRPDLWTAKLLPRNWSKPCNWTSPSFVSVTPRSSSGPVLWESLKRCVTNVCQRSSPSSKLSARVTSCEWSTKRCATNGKDTTLIYFIRESHRTRLWIIMCKEILSPFKSMPLWICPIQSNQDLKAWYL